MKLKRIGGKMGEQPEGRKVAYLVAAIIAVVGASGDVVQSQTPTKGSGRSLWDHNGSTVYLVANGSMREFYYDEPRIGMREAGARSGSLLFRGRSVGGIYTGTAFTFDSRCGQRSYEVRGPILDNYERVVLLGQAPRLGPDCRVRGMFNDKLQFTLLRSGTTTPSNPAVSAAPSLGPPADQVSVRMEQQGGVYVVPVRFNDMITLSAIVDSGASDMSIPADIVSTLIRTKTITNDDFLGQQTYVLADGSKVPSQQFRVRSIKVGNKTLEGVVASIASVNGEILLGQSFLNRFKSWSIDNEQHTLILR